MEEHTKESAQNMRVTIGESGAAAGPADNGGKRAARAERAAAAAADPALKRRLRTLEKQADREYRRGSSACGAWAAGDRDAGNRGVGGPVAANPAFAGEGGPGLRPGRKAAGLLLFRLAVLLLALLFILPPFYYPVEGVRTSSFFFRSRPESSIPLADWEFHRGIDLAAASGTPVRPAAPGIVAGKGWSETLGLYVEVRHLFGLRTVYAHLSAADTREGRFVLPGFSILGRVGATGRATGPHLHLEFRIGSLSLPPGIFLFFHSLRRHSLGF